MYLLKNFDYKKKQASLSLFLEYGSFTFGDLSELYNKLGVPLSHDFKCTSMEGVYTLACLLGDELPIRDKIALFEELDELSFKTQELAYKAGRQFRGAWLKRLEEYWKGGDAVNAAFRWMLIHELMPKAIADIKERRASATPEQAALIDEFLDLYELDKEEFLKAKEEAKDAYFLLPPGVSAISQK